MDAGRAPLVQDGLEGGDGRGPLRVVLLPERFPVAGKVPRGVVSPVDDDHQPRNAVEVAVEVDAALKLGGEADQGVVDAGDVAPVRHLGRSFAHRWEMRVVSRTRAWAPWWRNWAVRGAQDGRAAAGAAADQDVRRGVDVDGDGPSVGADADQRCRDGQRLQLLAQAGGR